MKNFSRHLSTLPLAFFPVLVFAAEPGTPATYTLMAPIGNILTGSPNLTTYLQGVVQVAIGLAGLLAVIMVVVCGIRLMGTPSASGKSEAKECIWNAIFGVLLALGAWILLYTINPLLLSNELNLADVLPSTAATTPNTIADPYPNSPGWYFQITENGVLRYKYGGPVSAGKAACDLIASKAGASGCFIVGERTIDAGEASTRIEICTRQNYDRNRCVFATPLGINNMPCASVGSRGCTNVGGLPMASIQAIRGLQVDCNCNVLITGGTEYWLHGDRSTSPPRTNSAHAPGNDVFDLQQSPQLDRVIKTGTQNTSFNRYDRWLYNGFWYTLETATPSHWHACRDGLSAPHCRR